MKLNNLMQARNTISNFSNNKLSAALAYKMMKFLKGSQEEADFYTAKLQEIIEKYCAKNEDGSFKVDNGMYTIRPDAVSAARQEEKELNETDIKVPEIKFSLRELSEISLSVKEIASIEEFIIEEG